VRNALRVKFTASHVFNSQGQPFTVFYVSVSESLDISLLYFRVFGPDYFTSGVHRHGRLLAAQLQAQTIYVVKGIPRKPGEVKVSWLKVKLVMDEWKKVNRQEEMGKNQAHGDDDAAFIVSYGNVIRAFHTSQAPGSFQPVVERGLEAVGVSVPDARSACMKTKTK
jgi:hypothetical protein